MRTALFLVHLCFLLLTGNMHLYARFAPDVKGDVPVLQLAQKRYTDHLGKHTSLTATAPGSNHTLQSLIGDDMDDDDQDNAPAPKCRLQAPSYSYYTPPSYPAAVLCCRNHYPRIPRSLCYKVADMYILMRVLRI